MDEVTRKAEFERGGVINSEGPKTLLKYLPPRPLRVTFNARPPARTLNPNGGMTSDQAPILTMLAPLTDLVGKCGHTKVTRKSGVKKKKFYWTPTHQSAFDAVKRALARDVFLSHSNHSEPFDVHADSSEFQLGAVISQKGRPIVFFSQKLTNPQRKHSIAELKLLSIMECLEEFRGMLWGQRIGVFTDHMNLIQKALGYDSDRMCC